MTIPIHRTALREGRRDTPGSEPRPPRADSFCCRVAVGPSAATRETQNSETVVIRLALPRH